MIIGIDPGVTGAIAKISDTDLVSVQDMPTKKLGKKIKLMVLL